MRKTTKSPGEQFVKDTKRATRRQYSSEEKIGIVLDGLPGEDSIGELCRREGNSQGACHKWFKAFIEAGKRQHCPGSLTSAPDAANDRREPLLANAGK